MNRRTLIVLAAATVLLTLLAIVAQRGNEGASIAGDSAGELFAPELAGMIENIVNVQVTGAGDERRVSLERNDGIWSVAEFDGYAADAGKLAGLLIDLTEARIVEEKTANPDFFARLGVEPVDDGNAAGLEIALADSDGRSIAIVLGDPYGAEQRYARLADAMQSVLIDRNPNVARDASDWVRRDIVDIPALRIERVEIRHADGEQLVLSKPAPDQINFSVDAIPEGRELEYESIANVTGNVLATLMLEAVAAGPPADEPLAVVEFRTFDGLVVTVTASPADDGDPWLSFAARADDANVEADSTDADADADADADQASAADAAAQADAINARVNGWRYRIPTYKYEQLTRRIEDLLRDLPADDE